MNNDDWPYEFESWQELADYQFDHERTPAQEALHEKLRTETAETQRKELSVWRLEQYPASPG